MADGTRDRTEPAAHWLAVTKTARYYTLGPDDRSAVREIWIVLHGYSQLAGTFIQYFADLDDGTRLIVAPEALNRYYMVAADTPASERPVGATWMTREDREHEMADYVSYLDTLLGAISATVSRGTHTPRVIVVGFSQGAATATRWIVGGQARVDRLVLWGGLLPPETDLSRGPEAFRTVPLTLVAGSRDQYVTPAAVALESQRLSVAGIATSVVGFEGGHVISRGAIRQLVASI